MPFKPPTGPIPTTLKRAVFMRAGVRGLLVFLFSWGKAGLAHLQVSWECARASGLTRTTSNGICLQYE
jgi:hypothetical protein